MGHYAQVIEELTSSNVYWVGKPLANFSPIVLKKLTQQHQNYTPNTTCFFDDNLENVMQLKKDLGIAGCWVKDTGIFKDEQTKTLINKFGRPDHIIPQLSI